MRFLAAVVTLATALTPDAALAPATTAAAAPAAAPAAVPTAPATVETEPVGHSASAALDVALWRDPERGRRAMIVGTDQKGPLETYDLSGHRLQRINGVYPTGVDVRG